jgi:hypothetical protein
LTEQSLASQEGLCPVQLVSQVPQLTFSEFYKHQIPLLIQLALTMDIGQAQIAGNQVFNGDSVVLHSVGILPHHYMVPQPKHQKLSHAQVFIS